jgi:hypothetical protein
MRGDMLNIHEETAMKLSKMPSQIWRCRAFLGGLTMLLGLMTWIATQEAGEARCRLFHRRCARQPACRTASTTHAAHAMSGVRVCAMYYGGPAGDLFLHYGLPFDPATGMCSGSPRPLYLDDRVYGIPPCINCNQYPNLCDAACEDFASHITRGRHGCARGYDPDAPVPPDAVAAAAMGEVLNGNYLFKNGRIKLKLYKVVITGGVVVGVGYEPKAHDPEPFPEFNVKLERDKGHCCHIDIDEDSDPATPAFRYHVILTRGPNRP